MNGPGEDPKYGIEETTDVVILLSELMNAGGKAFVDGLQLSDLKYLKDVIPTVIPALSGINKVPDELGDMDALELEQLKNTVIQRFDIPQDKVEYYIEKVLGVAVMLYPIIDEFFIKDKPADQ